VEAVACEIARSLTSYKVIVEKSTVPVYTNEWIRRAIERNGVARDLFDVVSNPEFLREGTAVAGLPAPRPHRGRRRQRSAPPPAGRHLRAAHQRRLLCAGPDAIPGSLLRAAAPPPLLHTSTKSAEIIKHASNAFLA
jgi:UDPglucose 6-dehydrogenase